MKLTTLTGLMLILVPLAFNVTFSLLQRAFEYPGSLPALGVLTGVLEETGFQPAGLINATSYILWSLWLIAFGVSLLLR